MKNLTKQQVIGSGLLVLLVLAAVLYPVCRNIYRNWSYNQELVQNQHSIARMHEQMGVMQASDTLKIDQIFASVQKTGSISNTDLAWLLNMLKKNNSSGARQQIARVDILTPIEILKNVSPAQEESIYQAVIPMLGNNPAYNDELDKIRASAVMRVLQDKRAIPYLVPLLDAKDMDTDGQLRLHVQAALEAIGYK